MSMTGYGTASAQLGDGQVIVEIRALNHRYLDVRTTVTPDLTPYAHVAEQVLRKAVARGRYELRLRTTGAAPTALELDVDAARQLFQTLRALKAELGDEVPLSLPAVLALLAEPLRAPPADSDIAENIALAVRSAVADLDRMRREEGATLRAELKSALATICAHRDAASDRCRDSVTTYRERLRVRVAQLLSDTGAAVDPARLEGEIALVAERTDVTEELVRLESHAAQLEAVLGTSLSESVGRKIDFLLQELNREANTLAAKCQDAAVTHIAVDMKAEIERMRQQSANVL